MCSHVCVGQCRHAWICVRVSFLAHFLSSLYADTSCSFTFMLWKIWNRWRWWQIHHFIFWLVFVFFISPPFSILFPLSSTVLVGMAIDVITFTTGRHQTRDGWVRGRGTLFIPLSISLSSLPSGSPCLCALFSAVRWPPEVCLPADWNRNSRPHWLATGDKLVREEPLTGWGQGWKAS